MNPWLLLKTSLLIYQQEDYSLARWWQWWQKNMWTSFEVIKKPLQVTNRMRLTVLLGLLFWWFLIWFLFWFHLYIWMVLTLFSLLVFPALLLVAGDLLFWPIETLTDYKRRQRIRRILSGNKELIVIGITGSYGKTSVKELLYGILDRHAYSLMTPDNFNTVGGIERGLRRELSVKHVFYICEMGAYGPGDIADLCELVKPSFGVLTAVGPQHLERFKTVGVIAKTKSELIKYVAGKRTVVNWDSMPLREYLMQERLDNKVVKVSKLNKEANYFIDQVKVDKNGIRFELVRGKQKLLLTSPLFGIASVYNCALAAASALELGVAEQVVSKSLSLALPSSHRLEVTRLNKASLVDNTYSANMDSFLSMLEDMKLVQGKKALVTPGLVELGEKEAEYHQKLGEAVAGVFDEVVLVGKSAKTTAIFTGLETGLFKGKTAFIANNYDEYWRRVRVLAQEFDWVVLENDLPERYS
jgi:UDP-N-acetylmuramoyl-tripeptide--D-alanyl-D-alanine ligase